MIQVVDVPHKSKQIGRRKVAINTEKVNDWIRKKLFLLKEIFSQLHSIVALAARRSFLYNKALFTIITKEAFSIIK